MLSLLVLLLLILSSFYFFWYFGNVAIKAEANKHRAGSELRAYTQICAKRPVSPYDINIILALISFLLFLSQSHPAITIHLLHR